MAAISSRSVLDDINMVSDSLERVEELMTDTLNLQKLLAGTVIGKPTATTTRARIKTASERVHLLTN